MATSSTTAVADALASFANAARQAVADIENHARLDISQASSEAIQAKQQRDEAIKSQHTFQLEEKARKQEFSACKAALSQAEMTIAHQAETISQLRREATQWKDQSRNWQEHFLRVEQERCKLSTRNDELVAAQLLCNSRPAPGPFTPMHKYKDIADFVTSSTSTKRASTSSNQPPAYKSAIPTSPYHEPATEILANSSRRSQKTRTYRPQTPSTDHLDPESSPSNSSSSRNVPTNTTVVTQRQPPQPIAQQRLLTGGPTLLQRPPSPTHTSHAEMNTEPRLIRRVQAIVHIPVKQEDSDEDVSDHDENSTFASPSAIVSAEDTGTPTTNRHTTRIKTTTKRNVIQSDEDDEDCQAENEVDREHGAAAIPVDDAEEEDDELMMGPEDNRKELYGVAIPETRNPNHYSSTAKVAPAPNRKRKVGGRDKPPNKTRRL